MNLGNLRKRKRLGRAHCSIRALLNRAYCRLLTDIGQTRSTLSSTLWPSIGGTDMVDSADK